jgi:hypothetical protein
VDVLSRHAPSVDVPVPYHCSCSGAQSSAKGDKENSGRNEGSSVSAVCKCHRSLRSKQSKVWRETSGRRESGLRLSGACWMEACRGKAKEARRELQGQGVSRDRDMSVEDQGRARQGSRVQECLSMA